MYNIHSTNKSTTMATKSDRNTPFDVHNFWPETAFNETPVTAIIGAHKLAFPEDFATVPLKVSKPVEATKFDDGKTNWSLIPFEVVEDIAKVLEFGAKKYAAWNFTINGGMNHSRVINSCLRHLFAYMRGEDKDPESGLSHLSHAGCNVFFLLYYNKYPEIFKAKDDRIIR